MYFLSKWVGFFVFKTFYHLILIYLKLELLHFLILPYLSPGPPRYPPFNPSLTLTFKFLKLMTSFSLSVTVFVCVCVFVVCVYIVLGLTS